MSVAILTRRNTRYNRFILHLIGQRLARTFVNTFCAYFTTPPSRYYVRSWFIFDDFQTRDDWAVARMQLAGAAEVNKHYLKLVDTALFVLCLDHTSPSTAAEVSYLVCCWPLFEAGASESVCSVESLRLRYAYSDSLVRLYVRMYLHRVTLGFVYRWLLVDS